MTRQLGAITLVLMLAPLSVLADGDALEGDVSAGIDAYDANCVECHARPARLMDSIEGDTDAAQAAWLDDFLIEHYAPDAQERADIIAYLLAL